MSAPFKRALRGRPSKQQADESGSVQVRVILLAPPPPRYTAKKGNVMKSLMVADARVTEVFAAIERALFGETP